MKKRILSVVLVLLTLIAVFPLSAFASETYVVEVYNEGSTGFTYVYDTPSETKGKNMGKFTTGTYITVYRTTGNWLYVSGINTKNKKIYGYIRADNAVPEDEYPKGHPENVYVVYCFNSHCPGYCYVYDKPNAVDGKNLGRINNGTEITYLGKSGKWFKIKGVNTKGKNVTGYIHNYSAVPAEEYYNLTNGDRYEEWVIDCSSRGRKLCYIYDIKDDIEGKNLGWVNNGDIVYLVEYGTSWLYVKAETARGKTVMGYIHTWCAHPNE